MKEGQQLTFEGECSDTVEYDEHGDVVLKLERTDLGVGDTDEYEWKGDDLWIRKAITFSESVLGFSVTLSDHPSGSLTLSWRGGPLLHGAVLKYEGGGMPFMPTAKKTFGHLYVQLLVTPPPTIPWSAEDAVKLQSVLGGAVATLAESKPLALFTAEPKLSIDRS
jgi:DnaJ-class molecular chaperone